MTSLLLHNLSCNNNSIKQCKIKKEELIVWFLLNNSFQCVFQCACMYSSQDIVLQSISVCVLESSTSSVLVRVFVCTVSKLPYYPSTWRAGLGSDVLRIRFDLDHTVSLHDGSPLGDSSPSHCACSDTNGLWHKAQHNRACSDNKTVYSIRLNININISGMS